MAWTEEREETLRKLWASGVTASQIAEELGDISRNAVIAKAHRLGLQSRPSPVKAGVDTRDPILDVIGSSTTLVALRPVGGAVSLMRTALQTMQSGL